MNGNMVVVEEEFIIYYSLLDLGPALITVSSIDFVLANLRHGNNNNNVNDDNDYDDDDDNIW